MINDSALPVAILAGGLATRLRPLTETIPKSLVEIGGRPFVEYQIELLRAHGLTEIVLLVGYLGEQIEAALGDGSRYDVRLRYAYDGPHLLGTGGALRRAMPLLGEAFFVLYGDTYLVCDYEAIQRAFIEQSKAGLMAVFHNCNQWDRSNVVFHNACVVAYDKHTPTPVMEYIDYGVGLLRAEVLSAYPADTALDLATVYEDLVGMEQLAGYEVTHRFYEIGSHGGLAATRDYLATHHLKGTP